MIDDARLRRIDRMLTRLERRVAATRAALTAPARPRKKYVRLAPEQVAEIRERAARGETQAAIAKAFDTHQTNVGAIVRGRTHKSSEA